MPEFIGIAGTQFYRNALAEEVETPDGRRVIWLFLPYLQIYPQSRSYETICGLIKLHSIPVFDLICSAEIVPGERIQKNDSERIYKLREHIRRLLDFIFSNEVPYPEYSLYKVIDIFRQNVEKLTAILGYRFTLIMREIALSDYYNIDYINFIVTYLGIITFTLECSADKSAAAVIYIDKTNLVSEITATLRNPPFYIENEGNLTRLAKYFQTDIIDLTVYEPLLPHLGHTLSYSVIDDKKDNFKIKLVISLPVDKRSGSTPYASPVMIKITLLNKIYSH